MSIKLYRMLALRGALSLECKGMKRRGKSAYAIIKNEWGLKGNKESVYTQFCELTEKEKGNV